MSQWDELIRMLDERMAKKVQPQLQWAKVDKVNWQDKVADVTVIADELELYDVELGLGGQYIRPKEGSNCLVLLKEGSTTGGYLLAAEELEGVQLYSQGESLRAIVNDLIEKVVDPFMAECGKIIVVQGTTINKPAVVKLQQKLEQIKTRFNKVLIED